MSWPNSLRVITLCLLKTLPALSAGTCGAFLSVRCRIRILFGEKHPGPGQLCLRPQLHRATRHQTGSTLTYNESELAVALSQNTRGFRRPPTQVPSSPTLFGLGDVGRSQPAATWLQDTHSHAHTTHRSPKKDKPWSANTHLGDAD